MKVIAVGLGLILILLNAGCAVNKAPSRAHENAEPVTTSTPAPQASTPAGQLAAFTITDGAGKVVLAVKAMKGAESAITGSEGTLGSLTLEEGKISIRDAGGKKIGSVKKADGDISLKDAAGTKIAKLKEKEGGYRLKDASDTMLLKIKPRDGGGYKVSDEAGKALAKVKEKGGEVVLSNEQGQVLYRISGKVNAKASGVIMATSLTLPQRAALITAAGSL